MRQLAAFVLAGLAMPAIADDPPAFRQGMWEFNRTVDAGGMPQTMNTKQCVDPTEDMKKQNEMLTKAGCKMPAGTRSGNSYGFTIDCVMQGVTMQSKSVITVESDSAYRIDVESQQGGKTTKEVLLARRIGDC